MSYMILFNIIGGKAQMKCIYCRQEIKTNYNDLLKNYHDTCLMYENLKNDVSIDCVIDKLEKIFDISITPDAEVELLQLHEKHTYQSMIDCVESYQESIIQALEQIKFSNEQNKSRYVISALESFLQAHKYNDFDITKQPAIIKVVN